MSIYDFNAKDIDGQERELKEFEGKVLLVVNTASKCGFTPQFQGLETLYERMNGEGFEVLGFPCGQFNDQELESAEGIKNFCELNYGVSFPMFDKIDVNGDAAHPLFKHLRKETKGLLGDAVKWNFTKFLVDRNGKVLKRYAPQVDPLDIEKDIRKLL
ncbi:glutathione peroxidase [Proteiniclasticum ruminis]|uniref:Glutathione peroxidase n=1 Tax=Proteiniclasticum ruminis TaxID=398199 RepID=A0A1I5E7H6_9CLOT|nr:glutathione peroxidase [Proteiniclasticum ruminis]SFO07445.1 glutathione peroxidase [Proteiniclasticum ruminis]